MGHSHLAVLSAFTLVLVVGAAIGQEASAELTARRADYATVAANLVPGLRDGTASATPNIEPAVIRAKEMWRVVALEGLETRDHRIKGVAKEAAEAHSRILDLAKESGDPQILLDIGVAIWLANPLPLFRGAVREMNQDDRYKEAVMRRRAVTFLLPELAKDLAGPEVKVAPLAIDFDENWFGVNVPDRVKLKNVGDASLTDCTVQIDIRGKDGKWVRNVHFVPQWPRGSELFADYLSSDPSQLAAISGTTAVEVQDLSVSLWCDQLRSEGQELHYPGKGRDEDRMRQLEELLSVTLDYVEQPFFESGPCIGVTLHGVRSLPRCTLTLVCHGGNRVDQKLDATIERWLDGGRQSLQSRGALHSRPDEVEVTVQLDGVDRAWKRTVKIGEREPKDKR